MGIENCHNINDFRTVAKKRLPRAIFDLLEGGADDEYTLRNNPTSFDSYHLIPDTLVDVSLIDTKVRILGAEMQLPFYLSPSGGTGLFHHGKETAVAKAAEKAGIYYGLSSYSTQSIKHIGNATNGPKMFQIYVMKDRAITRDHIAWAKETNYTAICLSLDSSIPGNRERDLRNGLALPPKLKPSTFIDFAMHPWWTWRFLTSGSFEMPNISSKTDEEGNGIDPFEFAHNMMDLTINWKDAEWLAGEWNGPFAIKGIQSVGDAKKAVKMGATTIIVSNQGGRQLDAVSPSIHRIAPIRQAVGNDIEIVMDSGVRRGTHILKALALGADAVSFARPYIYGLAAGGEAGVTRVIELLKAEVERGMGLMGVTAIDQLSEQHIMRALV